MFQVFDGEAGRYFKYSTARPVVISSIGGEACHVQVCGGEPSIKEEKRKENKNKK